MAKINIEGLTKCLESEMRKTLDATLRVHFSEHEYNSRNVHKTFTKELIKKCNSWESVPNKFIKSG